MHAAPCLSGHQNQIKSCLEMKPCILEGLKHLCCPLHLAAQTQVPVCAGDANGDAETARGMAESKLSAFGLPIPRGMFMRQRSGGPPQARGGRPPLAPTSPEPPSSATSSSRSLNTAQGAYSTPAEPCTSGYETPVQVSHHQCAQCSAASVSACTSSTLARTPSSIHAGASLMAKPDIAAFHCCTPESSQDDCHCFLISAMAPE